MADRGCLYLTRGLPASGKTTWAKAQVQTYNPGRAARVNRDDIRASLFGGEGVLPYGQEQTVTAAQRAQVEMLLRAGMAVIVDDTNLRAKYVAEWLGLASSVGADWHVVDHFLEVPVETCIIRDANREVSGQRFVGAAVIKGMHDRFVAQYKGARPPIPAPKLPDTTGGHGVPNLVPYPNPREDENGQPLTSAWIFDLDGTLARMTGRGPYDWPRVGEDELVEAVASIAYALYATYKDQFILMSGRDEVCRSETEKWLDANGVNYDELYMRPQGSTERDSIVKYRLFNEHIRDRFHVAGVVDDRDQVVDMWRALGLQCFQAAPGAF